MQLLYRVWMQQSRAFYWIKSAWSTWSSTRTFKLALVMSQASNFRSLCQYIFKLFQINDKILPTFQKFHQNSMTTFWVISETDRQTGCKHTTVSLAKVTIKNNHCSHTASIQTLNKLLKTNTASSIAFKVKCLVQLLICKLIQCQNLSSNYYLY